MTRGPSLSGRVILVTGASSGVGEATVEFLASEGAIVFAAARRRERLEQLIARVAAAGGTAFPLVLDVLDEAQIARAVEVIGSAYGRLDGLVNNAGMLGPGSIGDADISSWRRSIDTNLMGPILVTQAALPLIRAGSHPDVINVSSTVTRGPNAGTAPYGAAKTGLNAFTESIRKELAPLGIRVTLLILGLVDSEFYDHGPTDYRRGWMKEITALSTADVARSIAYILQQPAHVNVSILELRPTAHV